MVPIFLNLGGPWITILAILTWIAFTSLSHVPDADRRWAEALSTTWLMKAAVGIALLAWAWAFGRLFLGDAYLPGAGAVAELSTLLLVLILALAGAAWLSLSWRRFHPWITYGLVLALILSSGPLLVQSPEEDLSQATEGERRAIAFVQGRLDSLGCFAAAGVPVRQDGVFEALTASAVISFQMANGLLQDPRVDTTPGAVRPIPEFRLLARPFPFLFGPKACPVAENQSQVEKRRPYVEKYGSYAVMKRSFVEQYGRYAEKNAPYIERSMHSST